MLSLLTFVGDSASPSRRAYSSCSPAPGKEAEHYHDQRNHQKEMDEPSQRVTGYETKQPQNDQNCRNCE